MVIPRADLDLWLDDPGLVAGLPITWDEVEAAGFTDGNWQYDASCSQATWDDAIEAAEIEVDLIATADARSSTAAEFDNLIDGDLDDWQIIALGGIDAGVGAAVYALNAAGCVTTTSCRGHPGRYVGGGRDFPRVSFMTDAACARLVRHAAGASGCAFGVEPPIAEVFAVSVCEMMAFAEAMLAARSEFDALPRPAHRANPPDPSETA